MHYDVFKNVLLKDEKILWSGQPNPYIFSMWEITMILFGILFTGSVIHKSIKIGISMGNGIMITITSIPFVIVGVYITIESFFKKFYKSRKTYYAVTNERIIIVLGKDRQHVRTCFINDIPVLNKSIRRSGNGTIMFDKSEPLITTDKARIGDFYSINAMAFYDIDGAKKVYDLINEKRRER